MKTYVETEGKEIFDWNAFLDKEIITEDEWFDAWELAGNWTTCACGNQCDIIPRDTNGSPKDIILYRLGGEFHCSISSENISKSKDILKLIEERSAFLINEIKLNS